jgi:hypothetical protein
MAPELVRAFLVLFRLSRVMLMWAHQECVDSTGSSLQAAADVFAFGMGASELFLRHAPGADFGASQTICAADLHALKLDRCHIPQRLLAFLRLCVRFVAEERPTIAELAKFFSTGEMPSRKAAEEVCGSFFMLVIVFLIARC